MSNGKSASLGWHGIVAACLVFCAAAGTSSAFAAKPAVPAVSITAGLKQLQFWWSPVAGATRYELWFLPTTGATWVKYAQLPPSRTQVSVNISAHFLHWTKARYVLKACNADGCGRTPHLFVSHLMQQTVGYFTRPVMPNRYQLGSDVELGEWGNTLAAAFHKDGGDSAGVAVYRKGVSGWTFEAELLADPPEQDLYGRADPAAVTISANSDVIALGVNVEIPPGATDPESGIDTGAVYVFRRSAAGWVREQKLASPVSQPEDRFGRHVELDESGTLLAVWRRFGDPPEPPPGPWTYFGFVELFRYSGGAWVHAATIPAVDADCATMGLSGDGNTLVRSCGDSVEVRRAPGWQRVAVLPNTVYSTLYSPEPRDVAVSHDGTSFAVRSVISLAGGGGSDSQAWVNVYRLGTGGWAREASLAPGEWSDGQSTPEDPNEGFGMSIAMSRDGRFVAVGAARDVVPGHGVVYPPTAWSPGLYGVGAVYVFERKPSGWQRRQFIKPNEGGTDWQDVVLIGQSLSFARNGKDLAVGGGGDPGVATVIGGPAPAPARQFLGAVWLY